MKENIQSGFLFLAIIAGCFMISVPYRYLHEHWLIDHCLALKHGSFDYSKMSCDVRAKHLYIPYHVRHPHDKSIAVIAVVCFILFSSSYGLIRLRSKNNSSQATAAPKTPLS
jgi:hypothetical protein